jgi:hypothetical protein
MHKPRQQSQFYQRDNQNNFGRTEVVDGQKYTTLIEVDLTEQQDWTIFIDTQQITYAAGETSFASKVQALVEVGSGNGLSTVIVDATDLVALSVAGDHIKVAVTLVSALNVTLPDGGDAPGFAYPAPAPAADQALVSAFLAQGFVVFPPGLGAAQAHVPILKGTPGSLVNTSVDGVASAVPCRLNSFVAFNPSGSPVYLALKSANKLGEALPNDQAIVTTVAVIVLPSNVPVQIEYPGGLPFPRGLVWESCTDAGGQDQGAAPISFQAQLVRVPQANGAGAVQGVASINPTT